MKNNSLYSYYFKYKSKNFFYVLVKTILIFISIIPIILLNLLILLMFPIGIIEAVIIGIQNSNSIYPEDRNRRGVIYWLTYPIDWIIFFFFIIGCLPDKDPSIFDLIS